MVLGNLSTNGIIAIITGLAIIIWGVWGLSVRLFDYFSIGLFFFGTGLVLFGITDGFNDETPRGRLLFKIGILLFLVAFLILGYFFIGLI